MADMEKALLKWKARIQDNKDYFGKAYNYKYNDYIFVHETGDLMYPDYLSHAFCKLLAKKNLRHIRLHDLRHSCASLLLAKGIPMKEIQDWLGHSDFNVTANTYSHLDFSAKIQSAKVISKTFSIENNEDTDEDKLEILKEKMAELGINDFDELLKMLKK